MDLTSILPLLLGNKNPEMAKILSAMNQGSGNSGTNDLLASILANQNKSASQAGENSSSEAKNSNASGKASEGNASGNKGGMGNDMQSKLLSSLMGGGSQAELLMNLMGNMNKQKPQRKPDGLSAIQRIAPNDILGAMLKYFTRK